MRITINSTSRIVLLNGQRCRVWDGVTDRAVRVQVYVAALQVDVAEDQGEFEAELAERPAPTVVIPS